MNGGEGELHSPLSQRQGVFFTEEISNQSISLNRSVMACPFGRSLGIGELHSLLSQGKGVFSQH